MHDSFFLNLIYTNACANSWPMNYGAVEIKRGGRLDDFKQENGIYDDPDKPLLMPLIKGESQEQRAERILRKLESSSNYLENVLDVLNRVSR